MTFDPVFDPVYVLQDLKHSGSVSLFRGRVSTVISDKNM